MIEERNRFLKHGIFQRRVVVLDGGSVLQADLLHYPQSKTPGSGPVRLISEDPQHFYTAESGWVNNGSKAPDHHAFVPENGAGEVALAKGSVSISVPFVWQGPEGVTIRRTYTFKRASYEIEVRDQVVNAGAGTWQGTVYRQLLRTPPQVKSGMTNPESFSFNGATWWDGSYQRRKLNEDFLEDGRGNAQVKDGWIAILCETDFVARTDDFIRPCRDLAMQAAAAGADYVWREEVPAERVEKEKEIFAAQLPNEGKPANVIDKILVGKLDKFYSEVCLMEQAFIKDDKKSVGDLVKETSSKTGENIVVRRFARFRLGQD